MRWVTARELEQWARSISARTALPKIVSDLILASSADIAAIRFPSGDKGQVRGFDGVLVSDVGGLNVPVGKSYWEIGVEEDYKGKAKSDFEKRTKEVTAAEQAEITLVLVSPWTWDSSDPNGKLENWVGECKASSSWKDVRYIDGSALETWLEQRPAVAALHARRTFGVKPLQDVRSTDEFWSEFVGQFQPALTEEVLLCEREAEAKKLVEGLLQRSNVVSIIGDSPDEVVAFAIAAIRKAQYPVRDFLEIRTLIVDSLAAGRELFGSDNLVLLLRNDASRSPTQFATSASVLVPLGRAPRPGGPDTLTRPSGYGLGKALISMGIDETKALTLARGSGRSLTVLARLIPGGSFEEPHWLNEGTGLLPAILAGAWDSTNPLDCSIVQQIAGGTSYPQIERLVRAMSARGDPPFDLAGPIWKVRAPMDAFVRVGGLIAADDAALLRSAMLKVFGRLPAEPDPDAVVGVPNADPEGFSEWLRDGLATTLLLFAVWGEQARLNLGNETGQEFADRLLRELPGLSTNPRLLMSLKDELPLLAEAAPAPLLSALEQMLEGDGEMIRPIFNGQEGILTPIYRHTGVLWALETLAWDPEYFHRAVLALAKLAKIDPGVKIGNTPAHSLTAIFLLWYPNTNASSAQRMSALREIARTFPEVGWKLVTSLLPSTHAVTAPTARPRLREAGASDRRQITYRELWEDEAAVARFSVELAAEEENRWLDLVPRLHAFAPAERQNALAALDRTMSIVHPEALRHIWTRLRDEIRRHQRFNSAKWALPADQLAPFLTIETKYAPTDPVTPVVPLFDTWALDDNVNISSSGRQRQDALRHLYDEQGPNGILRLAQLARVPYLIIEALGAAALTAPQIEELLSRSLRDSLDSPLTRGLSGIFRQMVGAREAEAWLRATMLDLHLTDEAVAFLLQAWPDGRQTWSVARRFGPKCVVAYWTKKAPTYVDGPRRTLLEGALMLLRFGRAIEAIQSTLNRINEVPTNLLFQMLDGVVGEINSKATPVDTMVGYYLEKTLEALDGRPDATDEQVALREYSFLPILEFSERSLRIHGLMSRDPDFYHRILRDVYKGENEAEPSNEPDDRAKARWQLSYSLLRQFSTIPGLSATGFDLHSLRSWIDRVRELGQRSDRVAVTDAKIGNLLAHSPVDADGAWPHRGVREEIERLQSTELEHGIQIERYNMRGVYTKEILEGGREERQLAEQSRRYAEMLVSWPRTSALLTAIAKGWERDAEREDLDAEQRRLRS